MADDNFEAFLARVRDLDIQLSQSDDGVYTACTRSEPLFCHDADTREELASLVRGTLTSYASHFYGVKGVEVRTEDEPLAANILPVEFSKPVSRLRAIFDEAA